MQPTEFIYLRGQNLNVFYILESEHSLLYTFNLNTGVVTKLQTTCMSYCSSKYKIGSCQRVNHAWEMPLLKTSIVTLKYMYKGLINGAATLGHLFFPFEILLLFFNLQ